ncbi:MAG: hypothetical protein LBJ72_12840 [Dysgonamonadaceae bacterium]|jgi:hypothetical protein|nr:hypothetical protein [Dysgonamonadaceae bacterium]
MSENEDKKRILSDMSVKDAISRCGELQLSYEDTVRLLSEKTNPAKLMCDLQDPESEPYRWYQSGIAEGNLKLHINLECNVGDSKAKDAYKNLSGERRRQAINKKLDELFGI